MGLQSDSVTLGYILSGRLFTGLGLYYTHPGTTVEREESVTDLVLGQ